MLLQREGGSRAPDGFTAHTTSFVLCTALEGREKMPQFLKIATTLSRRFDMDMCT